MWTPHKTRVAILRGGPSAEYEQSLRTGKYIVDNLPDEYEPVDVLVYKNGDWYQGGIARDEHRILRGVDMVWNALHGHYGEGGTLQKTIAHFGIPSVGSGTISSAVGMNKILAKKMFERACIKTPYYVTASRSEDPREVFDRLHKAMPFPIVVKPSNSGSSFGITVINSPREINEALEKAFAYSDSILAEEFIQGREAMSGVIEGFRATPAYALFPTGRLGANFSEEESKTIQDMAVKIHNLLDLRDYSQADFIVHPKRGVYCLEVNTLPKLHEDSGFVSSLKAVGSNMKEFVSHTLSQVLNRK